MKHREPSPTALLAAMLATEDSAARFKNPNWRKSAVPPYRAASDAESLVRLGKRAARIAVQRCNGILRYDAEARRVLGTWTDDDEARADKACGKIAKAAAEILTPYGATDIQVGGDPRGFTLKFRLASGRSNSFGGEVWGV